MGKLLKKLALFVIVCSAIYFSQWQAFQSAYPSFEKDFYSLSNWDASKQCFDSLDTYFNLQLGLKKAVLLPIVLEGDLSGFENECRRYLDKGINWNIVFDDSKLAKDINGLIELDRLNHCDRFLSSARSMIHSLDKKPEHQAFVSYLLRRQRICLNDFAEKLDDAEFSRLYSEFRNIKSNHCPSMINIGDDLINHYRKRSHNKTNSFEYMIPIYHALSSCYSEMWQHHKAKMLLSELHDYTGDNNYLAKLQKEERSIQRVQQERHLYSEYFVSKKIGAANQFTGHTVMAMIYVDLKGFEWGQLDRLQAEESLQVVQQWYQKEAARNDVVPPYFSVKSFQLNQDVMIDTYFKLASVEISKLKRKDHQALAGLIVQKLGFKTPKALSESIKKQLNAEQVMLYFNFKKRARSFASRCYNNKERTWSRGNIVVKREAYSTCEGEYTFIFENPKKQRWQSYHFTMAHEGLHLFGADDLYNIQQAKEYATEDVMNYYMKFLEYNTIEDLTAYSIGWKKNAPQTPFPLNEIGN